MLCARCKYDGARFMEFFAAVYFFCILPANDFCDGIKLKLRAVLVYLLIKRIGKLKSAYRFKRRLVFDMRGKGDLPSDVLFFD